MAEKKRRPLSGPPPPPPMPPLTREEPPPVEEGEVPPGPETWSAESKALVDLFKGYQVCLICNEPYSDLAGHLKIHPKEELERLYPEGYSPNRPTPPRMTQRDFEEHPGGYEAAIIEKSILEQERRTYRYDVAGLIEKGYQPGYLLAQVCYHMVIARRFRNRIEFEAKQTKGDLRTYDAKSLSILQDLDGKISAMLVELEKQRRARITEAAENPVGVVESELAAAEQWIVEHQGELVLACPGCAMPLAPPDLPHWAFSPITTSDGVEHVVWSRDGWGLVVAKVIPLWILCYILRTSPEGMKFTAARRGEPWPEDIVLEKEERLLRRVLQADDKGIPLYKALRARAAASAPEIVVSDPEETHEATP